MQVFTFTDVKLVEVPDQRPVIEMQVNDLGTPVYDSEMQEFGTFQLRKVQLVRRPYLWMRPDRDHPQHVVEVAAQSQQQETLNEFVYRINEPLLEYISVIERQNRELKAKLTELGT